MATTTFLGYPPAGIRSWIDSNTPAVVHPANSWTCIPSSITGASFIDLEYNVMDAAWIGDFIDGEHNVHVVLSRNFDNNEWSFAEAIDGASESNVYDIPSEQIPPSPEKPTHIAIPSGTDLVYSYDLTFNA